MFVRNPALEEKVNYNLMPFKTKLLAWCIFLIYFIENGTLGILPREFYFVYRNVRLSDIFLYGVTVYSLFSVKEFTELYKSKTLILVKFLMLYMLFQFLISSISYKVDIIEYFFRLKNLWMSFLVFPFLLLLKRGGFTYLIKLMLPVAIVSNIFYIISALTGVALLPDMGIVQQDLPGGLKVFRVFGGTFYGELFFLGLIFNWNENKFRLLQVPLAILFILPHILAFGRNAWVFFAFAVTFIMLWSSFRKHNFKTLFRQAFIIIAFGFIFLTFFNKFIPQSEELTEAIDARVQQGQEDVKYGEGTLGTRIANVKALLELWYENPIFGIGMHPLWVIKPLTAQENIYTWGFSDIKWAGVLAAYGLVGFMFAVAFQLYYIFTAFKLLRKIHEININYFLLLVFLIGLVYDCTVSYTYILTTISTFALGSVTSMHVANLVFMYEKNRSDDKPVNNE